MPNKRISIDAVQQDVRRLLRGIADKVGLNLVIADGVSGKVTVRLKDVQVDDAVVTVAKAAGLGVEVDGCVLFVREPDNP